MSDTPLSKGMSQTQQEIMAVIGQQLRHTCSVSGGVCASSNPASCSGYSVPVADSRRFAGASGLIITVVTDLPQIEWGLKAESLTAVYQFAPAFVELRCLATLLFCQWPDDAIQRTAAAQFLRRSAV